MPGNIEMPVVLNTKDVPKDKYQEYKEAVAEEIIKFFANRKEKRPRRHKARNIEKNIESQDDIWHDRCAHLSSLIRTIQLNAATGLPADASNLTNRKEKCTDCIAGKQEQRSFPADAREHVEWKPGESFHIDIEVINFPSLGGCYYSFACEDRGSARIFCFPIKTKDQSGVKFKYLAAYSERMTGNKLREVVCDNAREFVELGSELGEFLNENGLTPSTSTPYMHNENPYAENANKILANTARTIRIKARLPKCFWAEAYRFAVIIHSMLVPKGKKITPFEAFERCKPDFSDIKVFGCHCFAWIPKEQRHKLDSKSRPAIYLGPAVPGKHGYRLYDPSNGEIFIGSSVIFHESSFGLPELLHVIKQWKGDMTIKLNPIVKEEPRPVLPDAPAQAIPTPITVPEPTMNILVPSTPLQTPKAQRPFPPQTPLRSNENEVDPFNSPLHVEPLFDMEDVVLQPVPATINDPNKPAVTPMKEKRERTRRNVLPPPRYLDALINYVAMRCDVLIPEENLTTKKISEVECIVNEIETPSSYKNASSGPNADVWNASMKREYDAHVLNKTWNLTPRPEYMPKECRVWSGKNPSNGNDVYLISGVWRYRVKKGEGGTVTNEKSRWCADGSRMTVENEFTFVSIARPTTIRIVASLAALTGSFLSSGDVPSAYVKSSLLNNVEVYVHQPPGFVNKDQPEALCLLNKALYGLPFTGKCWNRDLSNFLICLGFIQSPANPGLFKITQGDDFMMIASIVDDDIKFSTSETLYKAIVSKLVEKFDYKDKKVADWFLGMRIRQNYKYIEFDQEDYCNSIIQSLSIPIRMYNTPGIQNSTLMPAEEGEATSDFPYSSYCGRLRYATITRPDIEFALNQCCRFQSKPSQAHIDALLRIIGYIKKNSSLPLRFVCTVWNGTITIVAYVDSSFRDNVPSRRSSLGFIVLMNGHIISWTSRLTPCVAMSTTEAEYYGIAELAKELLHIRNILSSLNFTVAMPMEIRSDSNGAIAIAKIERISARTKHIDVKFHFI